MKGVILVVTDEPGKSIYQRTNYLEASRDLRPVAGSRSGTSSSCCAGVGQILHGELRFLYYEMSELLVGQIRYSRVIPEPIATFRRTGDAERCHDQV